MVHHDHWNSGWAVSAQHAFPVHRIRLTVGLLNTAYENDMKLKLICFWGKHCKRMLDVLGRDTSLVPGCNRCMPIVKSPLSPSAPPCPTPEFEGIKLDSTALIRY